MLEIIDRINLIDYRITRTKDLAEVEAESTLEDLHDYATPDDFKKIEDKIREVYHDNCSYDNLNSFLAYRRDTIAETLGYKDWNAWYLAMREKEQAEYDKELAELQDSVDIDENFIRMFTENNN